MDKDKDRMLGLSETYMLTGGRVAMVAQLCTAHFVLVGSRRANPSTYEVQGPYPTHVKASEAARLLVIAC